VAVGKGLWQTAGNAVMRRVLIDTRRCGVHASAVLEEPFSSATVGPANPLSGKKPLPAEVVGPRSASMGWAPVPECLETGSR
jgi:hypothetical protein